MMTALLIVFAVLVLVAFGATVYLAVAGECLITRIICLNNVGPLASLLVELFAAIVKGFTNDS